MSKAPIKATTCCGVTASLIAYQISASDVCLGLSRTLKVNGLLAFLGLDVSFNE